LERKKDRDAEMPPCKAIVFDLDGTLLDTLRDIGDSMNRALVRLSFPTHTLEKYRHFVGDGMEMLARRAVPPEHSSEQTVAVALRAMREEYAAHWADHTRIYDGVGELLDALTQRGLRLAVCSNKPHDFTLQCVGRFLNRWRFDPVFGARSGVAKKPDPAGVLEIARTTAIAPAEFLYLGDTSVDMLTATAAGMFPVGVLWGFRAADELARSGAKLLIEHPLDLLKMLD
jgi:phosphoglycolate phosphatase